MDPKSDRKQVAVQGVGVRVFGVWGSGFWGLGFRMTFQGVRVECLAD